MKKNLLRRKNQTKNKVKFIRKEKKMALMSDQWIEKQVYENNIISPFEKKQIREGKISYGLSSYGYDARVSDEFKVFTNVNNTIVDPKKFQFRRFC